MWYLAWGVVAIVFGSLLLEWLLFKFLQNVDMDGELILNVDSGDSPDVDRNVDNEDTGPDGSGST